MPNTEKPVLYKAQPHHGVVALLTPHAYQAYCESWGYYLECGSWEGAFEKRPEIMARLGARVAAGTFTFMETDRYYEGHPMYRVVHTGSTGLLDEIKLLCTVVSFDTPFSVPFSSGDFGSYQELLDKSWGPHIEKFNQLLIQAMEAQERRAIAQVIADHPTLLTW